jgi:hypothetical protein
VRSATTSPQRSRSLRCPRPNGAGLDALADRLFDPDGFDRETLANIEELTPRIPTEEQSAALME